MPPENEPFYRVRPCRLRRVAPTFSSSHGRLHAPRQNANDGAGLRPSVASERRLDALSGAPQTLLLREQLFVYRFCTGGVGAECSCHLWVFPYSVGVISQSLYRR